MKKITRENFEGLRQRYPVLNKEEMRRYVGGNFSPYDENEWLLANPYAAEMNSIDNSSATVSDEEAEEMENDLWGTEADMGLFSMSGYGYGGYGGDIDGGELDEVVIYGNQYGNDSYYYGNSGDSDSDDWWNDDYSGYGSSYGEYYGSDYGDSGDIPKYEGIIYAIANNNDCFFMCISEIMGISPVAAGNDYGDYLAQQGLSKDKINNNIKYGITSNFFDSYMNNGLNADVEKMDTNTFKHELNNASSLKGMGLIQTGQNQYHAIVIYGAKWENGQWILNYSDPQKPNDTEKYTADDIKTFYQIDKNN